MSREAGRQREAKAKLEQLHRRCGKQQRSSAGLAGHGHAGRQAGGSSPDHLQHALPLSLADLGGPPPGSPHAEAGAARGLGTQGSLQEGRQGPPSRA